MPSDDIIRRMLEHEAYLDAGSPKVVFDIVQSFKAETFFLKTYVPKTHRAKDRFYTLGVSRVSDFPAFLETIAELSKQEEGGLVAIFSQVVSKTALRHIPMMDFSNSIVKNYGTDRVKEIMEDLGQRSGVILNSGRCFHFYGFLPLSHIEWISLMNRSSSFDEIGINYPKYQIEDGGCSLRLSTSPYRPNLPKVVDFIRI